MAKVNLGKDTSGRNLLVDDTTLAKIRWAEAKLGWKFALIQGSYMGAASAAKSGQTHQGGGAVDLRTWDIPKSIGITKALTALRQAGLIAWYRPQSAFPDHEIHALDYGNPNLSTAAKSQVASYLAGHNGLSGSLAGPDDGPKVTIPKEVPVLAARIDGVDISHWQGNVSAADLKAAKAAGVRWVYHKATESTDSRDPLYASRVKLIRDSGMGFGSYHFARPGKSSGAAQARYFLNVASIEPDDMRPMLDLEDDGGLSRAALTAWVGDFVGVIVDALGTPPFLYNKFPLDKTFDAPLWVARYSNSMSAPVIPAPWKTYTVWQFSNGVYGNPHTVAGLGAVDLNTMNGDPDKLTGAFRVAAKKPTPDPNTPEDDMPLSDADVKKVVEAIFARPINDMTPGEPNQPIAFGSETARIEKILNRVETATTATNTKLDAIATLLQQAIDAGKS